MKPNYRKCLWLFIPKDSQVYTLCKKLQMSISEPIIFPPHITVEYNMENEAACIGKWKKIIKNGIIITVNTDIIENNDDSFHILQLNVNVVDNSGVNVMHTGYEPHVSFAYQFKPFTIKDKIKAHKIIKEHHFNDYTITPILATEYCNTNEIETWVGRVV
jgi:hypothetical protein